MDTQLLIICARYLGKHKLVRQPYANQTRKVTFEVPCSSNCPKARKGDVRRNLPECAWERMKTEVEQALIQGRNCFVGGDLREAKKRGMGR